MSERIDIPDLEQGQAVAGELRRGVVTRCERNGTFEVAVNGARMCARQAESCLLRPAPGDLVLVCPGDPAYVLGVLARLGDEARVWQAPDSAPVTLSAKRVDIDAPEVAITAAKATLTAGALHVVGQAVSGASDTLEWVGRRLQTVAEWSAHRAGSYTRSVDGVDTVDAEHMLRRAARTMVSRAMHAVVNAKEDVRIAAQRIHMG